MLVILCMVIVLSSVSSGQTPTSELQVYSLKHANVVEVRRMLTELLGDTSADVRIISDTEQNKLVIAGNPSVQRLAVQLIEQVDRPGAAALPKEPATLKSYPVPPSQIPQRLAELRNVVSDQVRITSDSANGTIFVMATATQHQAIQRQLQAKTRAAAVAAQDNTVQWPTREQPLPMEVADPATLFPRKIKNAVTDSSGATTFHLKQLTAAQCQRALRMLLDNSLWDLGDNQFRYSAADSAAVTLSFDPQTQTCRMTGDRTLVNQFALLIQRFEESQHPAPETSFRFVPLKNVSPDVLNDAIRIWKQSTQAPARLKNANGGTTVTHPGGHIRPVGFVQQDGTAVNPASQAADAQKPDGQNADTQNADGQNPDPANPEPQTSAPDLRRPSSDVTVQPLPDLDVLILRGRDADVDELVRIIEEIERLSDEAAPEIDVTFLKHVQGGALNDLIETVLDDLTGPLQGRISITPLVKPNALLLIGWGEAVNAAKKLIQQLDRPVSPESQMRVFPLKYAPVAEVTSTITEFLNGRGGLAPDVTVTSNPRTNSLIVHAAPRDMQEVEQLIERLDVGSAESVNQARMVRLRNSLAADVAATITSALTAARGGATGRRSAALEMLLVQPDGERVVTSGLLDSVTLTPDPRTNSIFVTGPADSLPLVERLIEQLDESPAASAQIKVFQVANGDASDLVTVLRSLFPEAATSSVPQLSTAEGDTSMVPVRFSVDVRTNTIVATGASGDLQIIEALLLRLDQAESKERVNQVYRLKNSPATDVAQAVNDFLRSERIVSQAAPGRLNPFQQIEQEVVVVPEPVRNSLIISATPRYFEQILELVEDLDDQPPQVMIQVILAEVDLDNFHEFGVELGLQDSLLFDRSLLGELLKTTVTTSTSTPAGVVTTTADNIIGATNSPGFNFNNEPLGNSGSTQSRGTAGNVAGQALSHFSLGRVNSELEYGGLVLSASSENVSVLLRALDQSGSMEVLSRPQIMTLDNQQAFIQVGQRVPRIVNSQLTQLGQINSLALEDVGLLLGVTPRISPDGHVVMELDAEKSEVGPERDGIPISVSNDGSVIRSPRVDVTTAQTTVSAASGQTIVIGGLITNSNQTLSRKVPWLGDLPVLGNLFRYDGYTNRRTELLIILTPHVIRGESEAEYLKQVEMSRMSWVSGDVFQWLETPPASGASWDDSGVPVIYPDEVPTIDLNPTPEYQLPPIDPVPPAQPDPPQEQPQPPTSGVQPAVGRLTPKPSSRVTPASLEESTAVETTPDEPARPNKRGWFSLPWGTK